jgi:hypothetical protein
MLFARCGAGGNDGGKCLVAADTEAIAPEDFGEAFRNSETVERDDRAFLRFDPIDFGIVAVICHRKNPAAICEQKQLGGDGFEIIQFGLADGRVHCSLH